MNRAKIVDYVMSLNQMSFDIGYIKGFQLGDGDNTKQELDVISEKYERTFKEFEDYLYEEKG